MAPIAVGNIVALTTAAGNFSKGTVITAPDLSGGVLVALGDATDSMRTVVYVPTSALVVTV